jgi:hypothetical protein
LAAITFIAMVNVAGADDIVLQPGVSIVIDRSESESVQLAARDLARDLEKVFGKRSSIVASLDDLKGSAAIVIACRGEGTQRLREPLQGFEAHSIRAVPDGASASVVLQGADDRGTIYAVYEFADRFLDVPPLWFWASWNPSRKDAIPIPRDTRLEFKPPAVRWRAWFPNDRDLYFAWPARPKVVEQAVMETMLRLKLNVLDVGDLRDFPEASSGLKEARLAKKRGLAVTTTHTAPVGASFKTWDDYWKLVRKSTPPKLSLTAVRELEEFWQYFIDVGRRENLEMIWSIGFRGDGDQGFFELFHDAPTSDRDRAQLIRAMMDRQIAMLKRSSGNHTPLMRAVLYNENSDYAAAGLLLPPDEPSLIWNFVNARRDHFPAADVMAWNPQSKQPLGYYYNLQFTSSGAHLAQAEGPRKLEQNFRWVERQANRPPDYAVVNVGNFREFVLCATAHAQMMWSFDSFAADAFLDEFGTRYFGARHGGEAADLYRALFDAYWLPRHGDLAGFERQYVFQDQRVAQAGEAILKQLRAGKSPDEPFQGRGEEYFRIVPEDSGANDPLNAIRIGTDRARRKFHDVAVSAERLEPKLPTNSRAFFRDNLMVQAQFLEASHKWLHAVAQASIERNDPARTAEHLQQALAACNEMHQALVGAEHDVFVGWYSGDKLFGVDSLRVQTEALLKQGAHAKGR